MRNHMRKAAAPSKKRFPEWQTFLTWSMIYYNFYVNCFLQRLSMTSLKSENCLLASSFCSQWYLFITINSNHSVSLIPHHCRWKVKKIGQISLFNQVLTSEFWEKWRNRFRWCVSRCFIKSNEGHLKPCRKWLYATGKDASFKGKPANHGIWLGQKYQIKYIHTLAS